MQEGPEWTPSYDVWRPDIWQFKLFIFYLFVVCAFFLVRVTRLMWFLWRSRKAVRRGLDGSPSALELQTDFLRDLDLSALKVDSLKRAALLTSLVSGLMILDASIRVLGGISMERFVGYAILASLAAEILTPFAAGMLVCTALYAAFVLLDGMLARQRILWQDSRDQLEPKP